MVGACGCGRGDVMCIIVEAVYLSMVAGGVTAGELLVAIPLSRLKVTPSTTNQSHNLLIELFLANRPAPGAH